VNFFYSKRYFQQYVYYVFSQALKLLVHAITVFHLVDSLLMLVRSKLEHAYTRWNTSASTHDRKLKHIQLNLLALCYNSFFSHPLQFCKRFKPHKFSHLMHYKVPKMRIFSLTFTVVLNFFLPCLELLAFAFILEILEIILCLLLVPHIKCAPLLDVHQPKISFTIFNKHLVTINHTVK
jgi:hypothetical protein